MKTPAERGRTGRWLYDARKRRPEFSSVQKLLPVLERTTGVRIGYSTYAEYENGARIQDKHMPALVQFWGEPPAEAGPVDMDLASAIRAQTEAITALVGRLDAILAAGPEVQAAVVAQTVVAALRSSGALAG